MDYCRIKHDGFSTVDGAKRKVRRFYRTNAASGRVRGKRSYAGGEKQVYAASMIAKFAVCAAACALVFLIEWANAPEAQPVDNPMQISANASDEPLDESLGKLKFVEFPGLLEVFSTNELYAMPIEYEKLELKDDDTLMLLYAKSGQSAAVTYSGYVKEVGSDDALGAFVRIATAEDKEIVYYGLSEVTVEAGQTLRKSDSIGSVDTGAALCVSVTENGRPMNPLEHFKAEAQA